MGKLRIRLGLSLGYGRDETKSTPKRCVNGMLKFNQNGAAGGTRDIVKFKDEAGESNFGVQRPERSGIT